VGSLEKTPAMFLSANGSNHILADHFLSRFADAYLEEMRDFVHNMLAGKAPKVSGEDGLRSLQIAIAAEKSHLESKPVAVAK
jgi:predicted dehydrogenase